MKIGRTIQSSYSKGKSLAELATVHAATAKSLNTKGANTYISLYTGNGESYYSSHRKQLDSFTKTIHTAQQMDVTFIAGDDYVGRTKSNFEWINMCVNGLNKKIPKLLEDAGIPKDVTFEFDYDFDSFDSNNIKITEISDEKYREKIEEILNSCKGSFAFVSCASRVMNGYISSIYYPWISESLERSFGQDINDLYIDENGNLGGVNENLQAALDAIKKAEKTGEFLDVNKEFGFPVADIEEIVKRMVAEKNNATPNISHMGYDGESIYTNDGEFKFGKDFDPNLFGKEKYIMRGSMAFYMTIYGHYRTWLKNEEKFY